MAERSRVNYASVVAHIGRAVPEDGDMAAHEAAVDTLMFLEERCEELDADCGPTAHLAILDLAAALLAFGGVRSVGELTLWLHKELPGRARELAKAVAGGRGALADAPVCSCLATPEGATWH
jgi:hypothetical protein